MAPPAAALLALLLHKVLPNRQRVAGEIDVTTGAYVVVLEALFIASAVLAAVHGFLRPIRHWVRHNSPLLAAAFLLLCAWDLVTLKSSLMPLPFFPGPDRVFQAMADDTERLFESTHHSLRLLAAGYCTGLFLGLCSGVAMGWSGTTRYWGMPVLKLIGPIPAPALIPLAMLLFTNAFLSAASLIALAVWFPVTMLTTSGIANVPASYFDVARTLGAGRLYLIFRVAIPAAMPSIFLGLFVGLVPSFMTLVAAETVGVKSGLMWYVLFQKGYGEFAKVYAALLIMAIFFSGIMTVLLKVRSRVLSWQKDVIRL
jgi:NitT/TauT family transport system permease protein